MATKSKAPKRVSVFTAKLRKEYEAAKRDEATHMAFLHDNNIDANAMLYKPDEYSTYNHYLFIECFRENSLQLFQYFIDNGVDLSLTGYNGETILHSYVVRNDIAKLEFALQHGTPVNTKNNDGNTPINEFIRSYGDGKVDMVMKGDEYVAVPKDFKQRLEFIALLLKFGADPSIKNNYGDCGLDWIAERKREGFDDADNKMLEDLIKQY